MPGGELAGEEQRRVGVGGAGAVDGGQGSPWEGASEQSLGGTGVAPVCGGG